jgi:hypothetical protein
MDIQSILIAATGTENPDAPPYLDVFLWEESEGQPGSVIASRWEQTISGSQNQYISYDFSSGVLILPWRPRRG